MIEDLRKTYDEARAKRKQLETELETELPAQIVAATKAGDAIELVRLKQLQVELPAHYAGASQAETNAREAWLNAESCVASEKVIESEMELDELKAERSQKEIAYLAELERLGAAEQAAHTRFNKAQQYAQSMKVQLLEGRGGQRKAIDRVLAASK